MARIIKEKVHPIQPVRQIDPRTKKRLLKLKKNALKILGVVLLLPLFFLVRYILSLEDGGAVQDRSETYEIKPIPTLNVPSSDKITVSDVTVDNFYKQAKVVNAKGDLALNANNAKEKGYSIIYFPSMDQFNISILKSPFDNVRKNAESDFVKIMGNEKSELCKLNVVVTTPRFANPTEAGKNYRLSWCN